MLLLSAHTIFLLDHYLKVMHSHLAKPPYLGIDYHCILILLLDVMEQIWEQGGHTVSISGKKYSHFADFVTVMHEVNIECPIFLVAPSLQKEHKYIDL